MVTRVNVLGFVVEKGKVEMEKTKVSGIADWPPPQNLKQLQSFLGFCNFYHRFISHYADLCEPLNRLRKKDYPWNWEQDQQTAFERLKQAFTKEPVLLIPDNAKPFEIEADASLFATGAVLTQTDTNGDRHPVAFISHSFTPAERNYQVYDREFLAILRALRQWRHYILGSAFTTTIHTDHANLTYYRSPQKLTARQTRWVIELMEYDIVLKHKPGKSMIPADALSRRHDHAEGMKEDKEDDVTALSEELFIRFADLELQELAATAQKSDSLALEALEKIADPSTLPSKWTTEKDPNGTTCLFYDGRLYVPDDLTLRRRIVSDHHDTTVAGHPGALATTRSVRQSYWWPGLQSFIRKYVEGCATCAQFKVQTHPTKPSLYPIPSASPRLFGSIGMDFMTDLPLSDGFDSIMIVVDHGLSKGVVAIPTSKLGLTAEHTAQLFIDNVFSRFGLPDNVMTDRGTQFDSTFFQEICNALQIRSTMTTAFHPQANGGTERVNREIQLYLSIFCINAPDTWAQTLKLAEFTYNNRPHADRSQSPFELMYGTKPKALPDTFYRQTPTTDERIQRLNQWRQDALIAHEYTRQKMKQRIKSAYEPFSKGDKVWLEGRNLKLPYNKKITTKREGPFTITEVLPPVNYRLKIPWKIHDVFHASLLTRYKENEVHGPNFARPPPEIIDDEPEWEIERILRHKGTKNIRYQVKWKGYDEMTWEPEENLSNARESIETYWNATKRKTRGRPKDKED